MTGEQFKLVTVRDFQGDPFELLVDLDTHFQGRDSFGELMVETWTAYGRPKYDARWTVGMFGNNFVNTDPCDYIPLYQLLDLSPDSTVKLLDNPLYREKHPSRFSRIVNEWDRAKAAFPSS